MTEDYRDRIKNNLEQIYARIDQAARRSGRNPEAIKLIAVSKTIEAERIKFALECGVRWLGENRVQEALEKKPHLGGFEFEYHLIGTLQKNKVNKAVSGFDWIQSVDSLDLARKISAAGEAAGKIVPVLLQVNLGHELDKSGVSEEEVFLLADQVSQYPGLSIRGFMTIPPFLEDPEEVRPFFRQLRNMADDFKRKNLPNLRVEELSMGMSHDFEVAIEEGASMVRIGTAIFGERQYP
jgi:pyridoxal phosphate enzyme (YggS family)